MQLIQVSAWSNGGYTDEGNIPVFGTHDWIALQAVDLVPLEESWWLLENLDSYLLGTELPDNSGLPQGYGDTGLHHVYYNSEGVLIDDSAANRAQEEYTKALEAFDDGNYELASLYLGSMSHYISDLGVFGHVMGSGTEWGTELHHSDYESSSDTRMDEYPEDDFTIYIVGDSLDLTTAYDGAVNVAYDTTFDLDGSLSCTWMDTNYDWGNTVFVDRAGESVNLCVNTVADVIHSFYTAADPAITLASFDFYYRHSECVLVQPSTSSEKALECTSAMVSDWLASAYIHTRLNNCNEGLDTDPAFVDQTTGRLASDLSAVSFGGPVVNPLVKYAEDPSTPILDRAPIMYVGENDICYFRLNDGTAIPDANLDAAVINNNEDMFVIEIFQDSSGKVHLFCYGFGWQGTYAAGKYFDKIIYPELDQHQNLWTIVKWSDTNNDGFVNAPDSGDTYTEIASG